MNRIYYLVRFIYRLFPLPLWVKEKIKAYVLGIKPHSSISNPESQIKIPPQFLDRKSRLLSRILPASQDGLEIGPLCWPTVKKDESHGRIGYVDFSTAEKSREKYKDDPAVNIAEIVETDYLWGEQTLPELVNGQLFDYVIASHVIEHVPDMLGWMREMSDVLKDYGILSLAIPDKRFIFDYKRDLTSFGSLIESYLLKKRRPGIRDIFDHACMTTKVDMVLAWGKGFDPDKLEYHGTLQKGFKEAQEYLLSDEYKDVHVNILTPASFLNILEKASQLGIFDFSIVDFYDTFYNSHEFLVSLQRVPRGGDQHEIMNLQLDSIARAKEQLA